MITWIQTTFQKHHKWLFSGLLAVVVVTFVLTIGPQSFFGGPSSPSSRSIEFMGVDLSNPGAVDRMQRSAQLSSFLNPDIFQLFQRDLNAFALTRTTALHYADLLNIPQPTEEMVRESVMRKPAFRENDEFSADRFTQFRDNLRQSNVATEDDFARTLREDWRIEQVVHAIGGPGFVLSHETEHAYKTRETQWSVQVLSLPYNSFDPEINPTDEQLQALYDEDPARFQQPRKITLGRIEFVADNYLERVETPAESVLISYFEENKRRFEKPATPDADGNMPENPPETTFADAREEVLLAWKTDRARRISQKAADDFTVNLWRRKIALDSAEYSQLLAELGVTETLLEPFSRERPPYSEVPFQLVQSLFSLDEERYFSDVGQLRGNGAVYIYRGSIPAQVPPFGEVKEDVQKAFREDEKRRLFDEKGESVRASLIGAVMANRPMQEVGEELGLTVADPLEFTAANPPREISRDLMSVLKPLTPGEVSPMTFERNTGKFIYLIDKSIPEPGGATETELAEFKTDMKDAVSRLNGWFILVNLKNDAYAKIDPSSPEEPESGA